VASTAALSSQEYLEALYEMDEEALPTQQARLGSLRPALT
jgi:hypothetical protein